MIFCTYVSYVIIQMPIYFAANEKNLTYEFTFFSLQNLLLHICKISTGYTKISKFLTYKEIKEMNVIIIRKYAQWVGICNNPSKGRKTWPWKPITNFVPG